MKMNFGEISLTSPRKQIIIEVTSIYIRDCLKIMASLAFSLVKDYIIENLIGWFHFMSKSHPFYYQNGRQAMIGDW